MMQIQKDYQKLGFMLEKFELLIFITEILFKIYKIRFQKTKNSNAFKIFALKSTNFDFDELKIQTRLKFYFKLRPTTKTNLNIYIQTKF
jgi:hypothetical protein